eukprot:scaffold291120_cov35-Tisochrysis_lutea.AAC.1
MPRAANRQVVEPLIPIACDVASHPAAAIDCPRTPGGRQVEAKRRTQSRWAGGTKHRGAVCEHGTGFCVAHRHAAP